MEIFHYHLNIKQSIERHKDKRRKFLFFLFRRETKEEHK